MELWHQWAGEGEPPVLLVHAGICDCGMWDPQWESLPARHRTVRLDLRGYGHSELPPEGFSHAADVIELLDRLDLGPVALVGASFGGLVSLDVAVARPDLVQRLVLVAPAMPGHEWSALVRESFAEEEDSLESGDLDGAVEVNLRTWVDGPGRSPEAVPAGLRSRVGEMQRRAFERQLPVWELAEDVLTVEDLAERIGEIAVPTLVITGSEDVPDMEAIAARLGSEIAGARREVIAGAAHLPNLERPEEFDRLVLEFLAGF